MFCEYLQNRDCKKGLFIWKKVQNCRVHVMYGKANGYALEAERLYAESFPNRRHPDSRTFTRVHQHLRENGSFRHHERPGGPKTLDPDVEERMLERMDINPRTWTRRVAMQEGISASSVWRILHHQSLCPCRPRWSSGYHTSLWIPGSRIRSQPESMDFFRAYKS